MIRRKSIEEKCQHRNKILLLRKPPSVKERELKHLQCGKGRAAVHEFERLRLADDARQTPIKFSSAPETALVKCSSIFLPAALIVLIQVMLLAPNYPTI
jgi:hypothetical protein